MLDSVSAAGDALVEDSSSRLAASDAAAGGTPVEDSSNRLANQSKEDKLAAMFFLISFVLWLKPCPPRTPSPPPPCT